MTHIILKLKHKTTTVTTHTSHPIRRSNPKVLGRQVSQFAPVTLGGQTHWPVEGSHKPLGQLQAAKHQSMQIK